MSQNKIQTKRIALPKSLFSQTNTANVLFMSNVNQSVSPSVILAFYHHHFSVGFEMSACTYYCLIFVSLFFLLLVFGVVLEKA